MAVTTESTDIEPRKARTGGLTLGQILAIGVVLAIFIGCSIGYLFGVRYGIIASVIGLIPSALAFAVAMWVQYVIDKG
jgi:hypothetical protein